MDDLTDLMEELAVDNGPKGKGKDNSAKGQVRDIKDDILAWMGTNKSLPNMKFYLETDCEVAVHNDKALQVLRSATEGDTACGSWVTFGEEMAARIYNKVRDFETALAHANNSLNQANAALATTTAERDTLRFALQELKGAGLGGGGGGGHDSAMPHPDRFDGSEPNATKRATEFRTWRQQVEARLGARPKDYNTEYRRILYAGSLLKGAAATGASIGLAKVTSNPDDPTKWDWKTATDFFGFLARKYANVDVVALAELALAKLMQSKEFSRFNDFLTEFTNQSDVAGWDNTRRVREFKQKVSQKIRDGLNVQISNAPRDDDFPGWVEIAQKLATNQETDNHLRQLYNNNNNGNHNQGGSNKRDKDPDAMDLDKIKLNAAKLPQDERDRRAAQGLCFNCGQYGHLAATCRNAKNTDRGAGGNRSGRGNGQNNNNAPRGGYQGGFGGPARYPRQQMAYPPDVGRSGYNNQNNFGTQCSYSGPPAYPPAQQTTFAPWAGRGGAAPRMRAVDFIPGYVEGEIESEYQPTEHHKQQQQGDLLQLEDSGSGAYGSGHSGQGNA